MEALRVAQRILEALGYETWMGQEALEGEKRRGGMVLRVAYGPRGDLRLERVRPLGEEVWEGPLGGQTGQFVRQREERELFFAVVPPPALEGILRAWEG